MPSVHSHSASSPVRYRPHPSSFSIQRDIEFIVAVVRRSSGGRSSGANDPTKAFKQVVKKAHIIRLFQAFSLSSQNSPCFRWSKPLVMNGWVCLSGLFRPRYIYYVYTYNRVAPKKTSTWNIPVYAILYIIRHNLQGHLQGLMPCTLHHLRKRRVKISSMSLIDIVGGPNHACSCSNIKLAALRKCNNPRWSTCIRQNCTMDGIQPYTKDMGQIYRFLHFQTNPNHQSYILRNERSLCGKHLQNCIFNQARVKAILKNSPVLSRGMFKKFAKRENLAISCWEWGSTSFQTKTHSKNVQETNPPI